MAYGIELISLGTDLDIYLEEAAGPLNAAQTEFRFSLAPARLRGRGIAFQHGSYLTTDVFQWLSDYRTDAKGNRPFLIGFVNAPLSSTKLSNLFASHDAAQGVAVVTVDDLARFPIATSDYVRYYLVRYALSFVAPEIRNHDETRECFFDRKLFKPDILKSLESGRICDACLGLLAQHFNEEIRDAVLRMISALTAERHRISASRPQTARASMTTAPNIPSTPVFTWVHLSDIHFGAGLTAWRFDQRAVARAIENDLKTFPWAADRVLVTGDVAFSAKADQYQLAREWVDRVATGLRITIDKVRIVPGNHDVDREGAGLPLVRTLHRSIRAHPEELDDLLGDEQARPQLAGKLTRFQEFRAGLKGHPSAGGDGLDWVERLPSNPGGHGAIRIAGLSSVWVSDKLDGKDKEDGKLFVPNMTLGQGQLERMYGDLEEEELLLVLTHHPPDWMNRWATDTLTRSLARATHLHLCGHVHDAQARLEKNFGAQGRSFRYVAGAAHGDPAEAKRHGYAWGAVRWNRAKAAWEVGWAPRVYVEGRDQMRPDGTRYTLDTDGFAWEQIDLRWAPPA